MKKVAENGKKIPYLAKALLIAAIACSLIPKWIFLPSTKSPILWSSVLFEGPKSALPPKNPSKFLAKTFKISPLLSLVARSFPLKSG